MHASDGTVETSEFKEIQDQLMAIQLEERKAARRRDCARRRNA